MKARFEVPYFVLLGLRARFSQVDSRVTEQEQDLLFFLFSAFFTFFTFFSNSSASSIPSSLFSRNAAYNLCISESYLAFSVASSSSAAINSRSFLLCFITSFSPPLTPPDSSGGFIFQGYLVHNVSFFRMLPSAADRRSCSPMTITSL